MQGDSAPASKYSEETLFRHPAGQETWVPDGFSLLTNHHGARFEGPKTDTGLTGPKQSEPQVCRFIQIIFYVFFLEF